MKHHVIVGILLFIFISITPLSVFAQLATGTARPFGGRVLTTSIPGITCAATYGALAVLPVVAAPATPYFIRFASASVRPGSWVLGWYNPIPDVSTCIAAEVPIPAFELSIP